MDCFWSRDRTGVKTRDLYRNPDRIEREHKRDTFDDRDIHNTVKIAVACLLSLDQYPIRYKIAKSMRCIQVIPCIHRCYNIVYLSLRICCLLPIHVMSRIAHHSVWYPAAHASAPAHSYSLAHQRNAAANVIAHSSVKSQRLTRNKASNRLQSYTDRQTAYRPRNSTYTTNPSLNLFTLSFLK